MFHASLLTPYHETGEHRPNYTMPPPDLIDGQEEYEIENILTHKMKGNQWQYLIKWKGYSSNENTWEPEKNLLNSLETLKAYKKTHGLDIHSQPTSSSQLLSPSSRKHTRCTICTHCQ